MLELLTLNFMQNALAAGLLASIVCGLIGPFIVSRRMVFISGGLSHTAFGGLGIAYWLGLNPLWGAFIFVLGAAFLIGWREERQKGEDLFIGILWASGVAVGIIFIHLTPGYVPDLMAFLFGNILTVSPQDLKLEALLVVFVALVIIVFFRGFVSITFDEEYAKARKMPVKSLNLLMLSLFAISIVALIQMVGIILVIALITIPVAIAQEFSVDFKKMMFLSALLGMLFCWTGLIVSYFLEIPSGATIIVGGTLGLFFTKGWKRCYGR